MIIEITNKERVEITSLVFDRMQILEENMKTFENDKVLKEIFEKQYKTLSEINEKIWGKEVKT